jgi:hypothetical protein
LILRLIIPIVQGIQQGFDRELLEFDTDIRNVKKTLPTGASGTGVPPPGI